MSKKKHQYLRVLAINLMVIISLIISSVTVGATSTVSTIYELDSMNRYSKVDGQSITYDGRGNVTDNGNVTYGYNLLNQQTTATVSGQTTQYLYDALGRRIGKVQNGVTTRYIHDLRQQVLEEHRNGSLHARFTYGKGVDKPFTMEQGGQTYYYHQDALGNVTHLSDDNGTVVEKYQYGAYGKPTITDANNTSLASSVVGNEVLFNGRRYNPETSTYHYRARVYNAEWGQFLQRDSIDPGLSSGNPQEHNRYSYVINNPINYTDPTGHFIDGERNPFVEALKAIGGAVIQGIGDMMTNPPAPKKNPPPNPTPQPSPQLEPNSSSVEEGLDPCEFIHIPTGTQPRDLAPPSPEDVFKETRPNQDSVDPDRVVSSAKFFCRGSSATVEYARGVTYDTITEGHHRALGHQLCQIFSPACAPVHYENTLDLCARAKPRNYPERYRWGDVIWK